MAPIPLPLRNALAHLTIRALSQADAREAVAWLADPARAPSPAAAAVLAEFHLVDDDGRGLAPMYAAHGAHVRAHATAARAAAARLTGPARLADATDRALHEARALWESELLFEVHEVLEPIWQRATGPRRHALQGLIQIAVAFHHLRHGNLRGARKLLADGRERLTADGGALAAVDVDALLADTAPWAEALAAGAPPDGPLPRLVLRAPAPGRESTGAAR